MRKGEVLFSLVCTKKKTTKNVEVKVDAEKGALGFIENFDNRFAISMQFLLSSIVVLWCLFLMTTLFI